MGVIRPLLARFPSCAPHFRPLLELPSPVERLPWGPWIKRDDAVGGSKARMLEFCLERYAASGRTVLAVGPDGSNWLATLAAASRARGFPLELWTFPQILNDRARANRRALRELGPARRAAAGAPEFLARAAIRAPLLLSRRVLVTPFAGTEPSTILAYVNAVLELKEQIDVGLLPPPRRIVVALGSGGIAAGLLAGTELAGLPARISAVRVAGPFLGRRGRILALAHASLRLLGSSARLDGARLEIIGRYEGRYGEAVPGGRRARARFAAEAGIELDDGYTAKAAAALQDDPGPTLFWHTFGTPDFLEKREPPASGPV
jgi:D-cysteine desulfhydrase